MHGPTYMLTQMSVGGGGDSDDGRKCLGGSGEEGGRWHPRSGMHSLFMMENFSRAFGRGGEMKKDVRILFHHYLPHLESGPPAGPSYLYRPPGTERPFFVARPEWGREEPENSDCSPFLLNQSHPCSCYPQRPMALPHPIPTIQELGKG